MEPTTQPRNHIFTLSPWKKIFFQGDYLIRAILYVLREKKLIPSFSKKKRHQEEDEMDGEEKKEVLEKEQTQPPN